MQAFSSQSQSSLTRSRAASHIDTSQILLNAEKNLSDISYSSRLEPSLVEIYSLFQLLIPFDELFLVYEIFALQ